MFCNKVFGSDRTCIYQDKKERIIHWKTRDYIISVKFSLKLISTFFGIISF